LIVDIFRLRIPDFFIMDAVVGMEGNGPASPELRPVNRILASDNAVAMDATMARIMGLDPKKLRFLQRAAALGLGSLDVEDTSIVGDMVILDDYKIPPLGGEAITDNAAIQEMMRGRTLLRPQADPEKCTACGMCIDHCPVSALSLGDVVPEVDADTCITCFCCQEICPEKAIALQ
jgi:Pyruvate/2-oxoacid:ferredoxin oxidoreductase delta subunit